MATPSGTRDFTFPVGGTDSVHVYSDARQIMLQLRRAVATTENIDVPSFKVAVSLTVEQALALAGELLTVAARRLGGSSPAGPAANKRLPVAPNLTPVAAPKVLGRPETKRANQGKAWTGEEEQRLVDAFDAGAKIPQIAKAHQRGIGGVQSRLIKLGKMSREQYTTFSPEVETATL